MRVEIAGGVALLVMLLGGSVYGQEPSVLQAHQGWVGALAFAPDGKILASGGADGAIKFWDPATGRLQKTWTAHGDCVSTLAYSADGTLLASGGLDKAVRLWDLNDPTKPLWAFTHKSIVTSLAFAPDGKYLASGVVEGDVILRDTDAGTKIVTLKRHGSWVNAVAIAADGKLASGGSDHLAHVWVAPGNKWKLRTSLEAQEGEVRGLAFSPDSKTLAIGSSRGRVHLLDPSKGKRLAVLQGLPGEVWSVAFSPDGQLLACGAGAWGRPGEVRLYNAKTWKPRMRLPHSSEVLCVTFSRDGRWLAAGGWDGTVCVWDTARLPGAGN